MKVVSSYRDKLAAGTSRGGSKNLASMQNRDCSDTAREQNVTVGCSHDLVVNSKAGKVLPPTSTVVESLSDSTLKEMAKVADDVESQAGFANTAFSSAQAVSKPVVSYAVVVSSNKAPVLDHGSNLKVNVALNYHPPLRVNGRVKAKPPKSVSDVGERI